MSQPESTRDRRAAAIIRRRRIEDALVRTLKRQFTQSELGTMFDQMPDSQEPLDILAYAVGRAWSELKDEQS